MLAENAGHSMPVTRYDVADSTRTFREYYWKPSNQPVFDDNGEIIRIIRGVEDVTDDVLASGSSA